MTGQIDSVLDHHATILGDDGLRYYMYRTNLSRFGGLVNDFRQLRATMRVEFTGVESDRKKDHPVALEVRVTSSAIGGLTD